MDRLPETAGHQSTITTSSIEAEALALQQTSKETIGLESYFDKSVSILNGMGYSAATSLTIRVVLNEINKEFNPANI